MHRDLDLLDRRVREGDARDEAGQRRFPLSPQDQPQAQKDGEDTDGGRQRQRKGAAPAKGQPVGLTSILGDKPSRVLQKLPQELQAIVAKADGNKGYRLAISD